VGEPFQETDWSDEDEPNVVISRQVKLSGKNALRCRLIGFAVPEDDAEMMDAIEAQEADDQDGAEAMDTSWTEEDDEGGDEEGMDAG